MFTNLVPITILLSAPATGKAVKTPAARHWLALLLFDKDQFNAYLQSVRLLMPDGHGGVQY